MVLLLEIKKIKKEDLREMFELNIKYNKNYHFPKQKELFNKNKDIDNHSLGVFKEGILEEYIVAFYNKDNDIIEIENFIWKNSKAYILLLKTLFEECPKSKYSLFVCDRGLKILTKILDKYFKNSYEVFNKTKDNRYGEFLNHVYIKIKEI